MSWKTIIASGAICAALSSAAYADNFFFSFTSDGSFGNVDGTVTGQIFGLTDNATSAASDVEIYSYPAGLNYLPGPSFSIAAYDAELGKAITVNSFTVTDGQITGAAFQLTGGWFDLNVDVGGTYYTALTAPDGTPQQNVGGQVGNTETTNLGGITFTAAPEPAAWAIMLTGMFGVGAVLRRRRAAALAHT
ncbi:MAG TPA: PEP-CTERM sorting domain-containing protein [Caulobacteraceae bacterium]|jgi:hypothetical protein|nr:PEP-CTERM sorting domain-containing protein [Caulobacteraceae bacterium]